MNNTEYINLDGDGMEYTILTGLTLSQKVNFVIEVADTVMSDEIGYAYIVKDTMFNYCLIKYLTDITIFETEDDFNLDVLDSFLQKNGKAVINRIRRKIGNKSLKELRTACDEAIAFRKYHMSSGNQIDKLLNVLASELNSLSLKRDVDFETVNKLIDIIPVMKEMKSKEVAKAIVEEFH